MASYSQEMRYIAACLGEQEIQRRIAALSPFQARKQLVRWEGGAMQPVQMVAWAEFAIKMGSDQMDGYGIYVPQDDAEMRDTVLKSEWNDRKYTTYDMPENLDDPEAEALVYIAEREADQRRADGTANAELTVADAAA